MMDTQERIDSVQAFIKELSAIIQAIINSIMDLFGINKDDEAPDAE